MFTSKCKERKGYVLGTCRLHFIFGACCADEPVSWADLSSNSSSDHANILNSIEELYKLDKADLSQIQSMMSSDLGCVIDFILIQNCLHYYLDELTIFPSGSEDQSYSLEATTIKVTNTSNIQSSSDSSIADGKVSQEVIIPTNTNTTTMMASPVTTSTTTMRTQTEWDFPTGT